MAEDVSKTPNIRWRVAALLFFATVINYVDRQTLSVLAVQISDEFGLSNIEYSNILQAFLICYSFMYVVWGVLIDRWGTRVALAVAMVWWSLANMLHGAARGALSLGLLRAFLGAGEAGNFLAAEKAISEWFPPKERGFANGLVNAAAATGAIIAPIFIVWIYSVWGWRTAFVVTGASGFVWMYFWLRLYWVPDRHPRVTDEERDMIAREAAFNRRETKVRWRDLFAFRQTWGLFLTRVVADPVWWFYLFWLPKYLQEERGFTIELVALTSWIPFLTADIGSMLGGYASGRLIKGGLSAVEARKRVMLLSALLMPLGMVVAWVESNVVAIAAICLITFAHMSWKTNQMTMTNDIYPTAIVGSVSGLVGLGSSLSSVLATGLTGFVVEHYSYATIFIVMSFLHPVAYLILRALVSGGIDETQARAGEALAA
jgi:ACS family hexuronate transporter-like MFS transporter